MTKPAPEISEQRVSLGTVASILLSVVLATVAFVRSSTAAASAQDGVTEQGHRIQKLELNDEAVKGKIRLIDYKLNLLLTKNGIEVPKSVEPEGR